MKNEVWLETAAFLNKLRCENTGRATFIEPKEYRCAMVEKRKQYKQLEQILNEYGHGLQAET